MLIINALQYRIDEFPPTIPEVNISVRRASTHCESLASFSDNNCICSVLPSWILEKPEMICPTNSIQKKQVLGSGQFGTVHKGVYLHGNAR